MARPATPPSLEPPRGAQASDRAGEELLAAGDRSGRRFSPAAIAAAVGELEAGVPAPVVCRRFGVSDRTLYRWRRRASRAPRGA